MRVLALEGLGVCAKEVFSGNVEKVFTSMSSIEVSSSQPDTIHSLYPQYRCRPVACSPRLILGPLLSTRKSIRGGI